MNENMVLNDSAGKGFRKAKAGDPYDARLRRLSNSRQMDVNEQVSVAVKFLVWTPATLQHTKSNARSNDASTVATATKCLWKTTRRKKCRRC